MITTDSGAVKIEGTDNWRNIFDAQNGTAEAVDQLTEDVAIVINGNKTTHTGGAAAGQFVLVRNSTITDITDGLYTAAQAIPANTVIDKTYLTSVSGGGLNALNNKCPDLKITEHSNSNSFEITLDSGYTYIIFAVSGNSTHQGMWIVLAGISDAYPFEIEKGSAITLTSSGLKLTFTHSSSRTTRYTFIRCAVY